VSVMLLSVDRQQALSYCLEELTEYRVNPMTKWSLCKKNSVN